MLGDTFTGKTSLALRFAEGHFRDAARSATVGAFFITKRLSVQGMTCKIQIWDTAGQEQFKKLAPMYYKNAAAAIVCYDVTSPKSFDTLKYWIDELQKNVPAGRLVIAMCATKCDLIPNPDTMQAEQLAQATGAMFMTTSAKSNRNVTLLFEKVAERVLNFQKENVDSNIPVTLANASAPMTPVQNRNGHSNNHAVESHPAYAQPKITTPSATSRSPEQIHETPKNMTSDARQKQADDDDNVVDPTGSNESGTPDYDKRCEANMLMCGDNIMKAHEMASEVTGQSCIIL